MSRIITHSAQQRTPEETRTRHRHSDTTAQTQAQHTVTVAQLTT